MERYPCRVIAITRPGYGGTPLLENNVTFKQQSDVVAALLDYLYIQKVVIYGISGGGPTAMWFAARHGHRCNGLILESSVGYRFINRYRSIMERVMFFSISLSIAGKLNKFLAKRLPKTMLGLLLGIEGNLNKLEKQDAVMDIVSDPIKLKIFRQLVDSFSTPHLFLKGMCNDFYQLDQDAEYPLDKIYVHTLVIHGSRDSDASIEHADYIVSNVKSSELLEITGGTHLLLLSNRSWKITDAMIQYLDDHG
jgi:pimeloyl-ACP methyl ester carboxylesterase